MEKLKDLNIEEKIGQMLMVGVGSREKIGKIEKLITKYKIARRSSI